MSKKNTNKNSNSSSTAQKAEEVKELSPEQVNDLLGQAEKMNQLVASEESQALTDEEFNGVTLNTDEEKRISDVAKSGNLDRLYNYLSDILKRQKAITQRNEEYQSKLTAQLQEADKAKKEADSRLAEVNKEISSKKSELVQWEKDLKTQQLEIDNGDYTGVIKRLIDDLSHSEQEIADSTSSVISQLTQRHKDYMKSLEEIAQKQSDLTIKEGELNNLKQQLENDKKIIESQKLIIERNLREKLEEEFEDTIDDLKSDKTRLSSQIARLQKEKEALQNFKSNIQSQFEDINSIMEHYNLLQKENAKLEEEINARPSMTEFDGKIKEIKLLEDKVKELELEKANEQVQQRKLSLSNIDNLQRELNLLKSEKDCIEATSRHQERIIGELHQTISKLLEDQKSGEKAFEYANSIDNDSETNSRYLKPIVPDSLTDLVNYLQQRMASASPEPFYYDLRTIRTFLAGLNMSPLSILWGISGTGKTSLPREFIKAMMAGGGEGYVGQNEDGTQKEPYRICAIQSGWRDSMDLLGYYNHFDKKYNETDFFKALYLASQNKYKNTMFFIILDEMNLSRPEHYFADFLSLMEQSENERYISINAPGDILPAKIKGNKLLLPRNVRFIGTANHDETTLEFAPKTYDRSNVMMLPHNHPKDIKQTQEKYAVPYNWLSDQFEMAEEIHKNEFGKFYKFLHSEYFVDILKERGIGIGNRFDKQSRKFISVFVESGGSLADAADHLITSRLFRSLKNRFDLSKKNLEDFRNDYKELFINSFNAEPALGLNLLEDEINAKV